MPDQDDGPPAFTRRLLGAADGPGLVLVSCAGGATGWEPPEESGGPAVVFVRRGTFARRSEGVETLLDGTVAYFERPGIEEQFAHPAGCDECLAVGLSDAFLQALGRGPEELPADPVYTSAAIDFAHRVLARQAVLGSDGFELYELLARLVDALLRRTAEAGTPAVRGRSSRPATLTARRRLVARAREALLAHPALGLVDLSRRLGSSPHHLSRVFGQETGQTLSEYRNRLRIGLALDRLEAGERDLTGLAADLGFADHAHMTRVMGAHLGAPPSWLRSLLARTK